MKTFIFSIFVVILWVNVVFFTNYDNKFELSEQFLAKDSTQILFAELGNVILSEYNGEMSKTKDRFEYVKFKNAISNNDTIYVYKMYKGLIPGINWPLVKIGLHISTEANTEIF